MSLHSQIQYDRKGQSLSKKTKKKKKLSKIKDSKRFCPKPFSLLFLHHLPLISISSLFSKCSTYIQLVISTVMSHRHQIFKMLKTTTVFNKLVTLSLGGWDMGDFNPPSILFYSRWEKWSLIQPIKLSSSSSVLLLLICPIHGWYHIILSTSSLSQSPVAPPSSLYPAPYYY